MGAAGGEATAEGVEAAAACPDAKAPTAGAGAGLEELATWAKAAEEATQAAAPIAAASIPP